MQVTNTLSPTAFAVLQIIINAGGRGVTPYRVWDSGFAAYEVEILKAQLTGRDKRWCHEAVPSFSAPPVCLQTPEQGPLSTFSSTELISGLSTALLAGIGLLWGPCLPGFGRCCCKPIPKPGPEFLPCYHCCCSAKKRYRWQEQPCLCLILWLF